MCFLECYEMRWIKLDEKYIFNEDLSVITDVNSWEACRDLCAAETGFICNSFDFEQGSSKCYLAYRDQYRFTLSTSSLLSYGEDCSGKSAPTRNLYGPMICRVTIVKLSVHKV